MKPHIDLRYFTAQVRKWQEYVMIKGVAWVDGAPHNLGKVLVKLDDGKQELLPTVTYIFKNIQPPIYELPQREMLAG